MYLRPLKQKLKKDYPLLLTSLLLIAGCSPQIHRYAPATRYVNDVYTYIINDSLRLSTKTYGDITHFEDKETLSNIIRQRDKGLRNVLLYGRTIFEPFYEYFLLIDNTKKPGRYFKKNTICLDTVLSNRRIQLMVKALDQDTGIYKKDARFIFQSLQLGPNYRREVATVNTVLERFFESNSFLEAYTDIRNWQPYDKEEEWYKLQLQLTFASFLSYHPEYPELLAKFQPKPKDSIANFVKQNLVPGRKETIEEIVDRAQGSLIIMINENHFMPEHRKLVRELLPRLKTAGFNYLALEALNEGQDSILNAHNAFPTLETGFYTREQNFANLLREAKNLGFRFVAYENTDEAVDRERGQAANLFAKTYAKDVRAKVIVLAGIDHILEEATSSGKEWLASVFKRQFGIDPLTVSQTHLNVYKDLSAQPLSLVKGSSFTGAPYNSVDFHILNNMPPTDSPVKTNFNFVNNYRQPVQLSLFKLSEMESEEDYLNKIPYRALFVNPSEQIGLELPSEAFLLVQLNERGLVLEKRKVLIKAPTDDLGN